MRISFIGKGNVGAHLYRAFAVEGVEAQLVSSRSFDGLWTDSDIYFLCVRDDALEEVIGKLGCPETSVIVHTAGTKPMGLLDGFRRYGVFYPMQTFSKDKALSYADIPIFLEACDERTMNVLRTIAEKVFRNVRELSSEQRKTLHVAAVFSSNFVNHMVALADRELRNVGLDYTVMLPLLDEVVDKLHHLHPVDAQTGPAVRGDKTVVNEHLAMISDDKAKGIYGLVSESIATFASKRP